MKIFILLPRIPYPLEKGDKLRAFNQLRSLSKTNEIHLCALNDTHINPDAIKTLQQFCKSIHILPLPFYKRISNIFFCFFNGKPFQVGYFFNKENLKIINHIIKEIQPDRIYCQLLRVAEYVKNQNIKKIFDYQDVFSKGVERRINTTPFYFKPFFKSEYKRLLRYENKVFDWFDEKIIISFPDRELIPHPERNKIHVIPNGVDSEFFKPISQNKDYELLFTGNMGYPPNINSAQFLVKKIMPLVWEKIPDVKLLLAGANPSSEVLSMASDKVIVSGWVNDMRDCYARAKIFIAPMQIGTGLQNKLLEAMAMKLPCITSPLANNALQATENKEILIGNSPEEYAQHILNLHSDIKKTTLLAEQGYNFVINNFNWENVNYKLNQIICS
ncbi:MAG TPA: glycosyltransferase [Bacteroidales bacterium]|nr:glycosyltransferase [Bacteroidales bacterium]HPS17493.1 glycosyltransferase [Bacteroidales bacterium]